MTELGVAGLPDGRRRTPSCDAQVDSSGRHEHGTLVLDRLGRILSCGTPAEDIFGAVRTRMPGRRIAEFIDGLFLEGSSPSYGARYLVYLCSEGNWRRFPARDCAGLAFTVELNLTLMATESCEREIFLLNVRRLRAMDEASVDIKAT